MSRMARAWISGELEPRASGPRARRRGSRPARMIAMTRSSASTALRRPSRMCARSSARARSYFVRRVTTSRRKAMNSCSICLRFTTCGRRPTRASMITPNVVCICGVLVELVDDDLRDLAPPQLEHDADALAARLVAALRDALDLLVADQLADLLDERGLVHLVRQLGDDDGLAAAAHLLHVRLGAQRDDAAPGGVGLADPVAAVDVPARWGSPAPGSPSSAPRCVASGLSMSMTRPSTTSPRLWGGILVAMPTAMPEEPLMRRFGTLVGRTIGSWSDSSKFGEKSTVSLSMSARSSWAMRGRGAPRYSAWPRADRRRWTRSSPARPRAGSAARTPAPCGRAPRRRASRRADGTCRAPRRPRAPTSCRGG